MAFAYAQRENGDSKYQEAIERYDEFVNNNFAAFTTSEHAYVTIGSSLAAALLDHVPSLDTAKRSADVLLAKQDKKTGNIPSEWGREAPTGEHLVDLIYTQNWALLGLHFMASASDSATYQDGFDKAFGLVLKIQETSPETYLDGCWRGMFDLMTGSWGGGNRYEGGADSIYTGWTNAPIAILIALEILGKSFSHL
jgi:hypothetical protein